jgi:hypothetical protein
MTRRTRTTGLTHSTPAAPGHPKPEGSLRAAQGKRPEATARPARRGLGDQDPAKATATAATAPERPHRAAAVDAADLGTSDKPGDMLILVHELAAHLKMENDALKARRFDTIKESVTRKQGLTRAYMQMVIGLRRNPAVAEGMTEIQRADLRRAGEALTLLMEENGQLLKININVINRFIGQVVEAVKEIRTEGSVTYGIDGDMDGRYGDHRQLAVALNREL